MTIKEKPLINAVSRLGALPGFLFANMFTAGFFAMLMCPVFGATFALFFGGFGIGRRAAEVFEFLRLGAIIFTGLGGFVFVLVLLGALFKPDESKERVRFFFGGFVCLVMLAGIDLLTVDLLRNYLINAYPGTCRPSTVVC